MKSNKPKFYPISRREFIRLSTLTLAGAGLAACSSTGNQAEPTTASESATNAAPTNTAEIAAAITTLKIMHNWDEAQPEGVPFRTLFTQFQSSHPNIVLDQENFDVEDIPTKVETAFLAGEEPDIVFQNLMSNSREWNEAGLTIPASPILTDLGIQDRFLDSALTEYTINGELVAIPLQGFVWPLWYNTELLEQIGAKLPESIDDLIDLADKARAAGLNPWVVGGSDTWAFIAFGLVVASMLEPETTERLFTEGGFRDEPGAVAGIELFVRLRDAGVFADDSPGLDNAGSVQSFVNGESVMAHLGSFSIAEIPPELGEKVALAGLPLAAGSPNAKPMAFGAFIAKAIWVTRNGSQKMEAVEALVNYIYENQNMDSLIEGASLIPPLRDVSTEGLTLHPVFSKQFALLDEVTMMAPVGSFVPGSVRPIVLNNVGPLAFLPETSAEDILDALEEAYAAAT